jgi:hypothetical protein
MTRTIMEMAREAGLHIATDVNWMPIIGLDHLKAFEALVRADEREACAKVCDYMASRCTDIRAAALEVAAENIRARGNI